MGGQGQGPYAYFRVSGVPDKDLGIFLCPMVVSSIYSIGGKNDIKGML